MSKNFPRYLARCLFLQILYRKINSSFSALWDVPINTLSIYRVRSLVRNRCCNLSVGLYFQKQWNKSFFGCCGCQVEAVCECLCLPGCSVFPGELVSAFLWIEGYFGGSTLGFPPSPAIDPWHISPTRLSEPPARSFLWNRSFGGQGWIFAVVLSWRAGGQAGFPTPVRVALGQLHVGAQCVSWPSLVLQLWGYSLQNVFKMLLNAFISWQISIFSFWSIWQVVPQDGKVHDLTVFIFPLLFNNYSNCWLL